MAIDIEEIRKQYKELFDYSLDLIYISDKKGKIIETNDLALKTLGYTREEIPEYNLTDILDSEQLKKAYDLLKEIKETGRQSNLTEFRLKTKRGSFVDVETYVVPLQKNGKIYASIGIARDLTDLRTAQENLKRSEKKYRFLYETTPYSIILLNSDGIIVDCNPTTETIFGYKKIELIGRHFKNISAIHQNYIPVLIELFQRLIEGEDLKQIDIQIYKKDGKLIWANLQASIVNLSGNLLVQAIFHDITDKKIISQELEESRNLYRTLVQTSPDAVIVTNMNGEIIEASQKAIELDRANSIDNIIGKNSFNLIIPEDRPRALENLQKSLKEGAMKAEYTIIRSDGSHYIGELNSSLIKDGDGKPKAFIGIMRDITEQKTREKLLRESEEQYRSLYQNALVGLWTIRFRDGALIRANNVSAQIVGYNSVDELIKNWKIFDFFDVNTIGEFYKKLKEQGEISGFEISFKDLRGTEKVLSIWAKLFYEPGYIEGCFIDITDFKSMQYALQESEQKYRHLFENSPNMIILLDSNGIILDANTPFLNTFNYKHEDLIGKDFQQLGDISLNNLSIYKEKFINIFNEGVLEPFELQVEVKDDKLRWMNIQGSLIDIEGKKLVQVIYQDINERKVAEQKLKESEEKYRIISENANDLITIIDENYKHEYVNEETHKRIAGYSKEDLIGTTPLDRIHPEDANKAYKAYKNGAISGEAQIVEFRYRKKDGTWMWLESLGKKFIDRKGDAKGLIISRDITERKVTDQRLKESEEKFRTITEQSLMGIIIIQDNIIKYVNEEAASMLDYTVDEILNTPQGEFINYLHPDDRKIAIEQAKKRQLGIETDISGYKARCLKKNGEIVWIQNYSKTIEYDGSYADLITVINITDKVKAEEKLKESEEKYRHLFEGSPYSIGLLDLNGTLLEVNEATNKFLSSRTKDELIGENFREIFFTTEQDKSLLPTLTDYIKKVIKDEIREPLEVPIIRSIGGVIWISLYGSLIKIGDKTLLQFIGQDITDRKRAEQNLIKSEEKYRLLFENSPNAIILANSKGIILDFNSATENILGVKKSEMIGKNYMSFTPQTHIELIQKRYKNFLEGKELKPVEILVPRPDGCKVWINYQNSMITTDDEVIIQIIAQDITKKKEAELIIKEELIKLKELEQIRKDLISRVSHELKTPLIPVISGTELLTTLFKDQIGPEALEIIEMIEKGGSRLRQLIDKLINVSRIEYNKLELKKGSYNLSEIIRRCTEDMKFLIAKRELTLTKDIPDNLYLEIDEMRMEEVIMNLLSNAIKNTPRHGSIALSLQTQDHWAILSVSDTGVGLTEKEMDVLFTRFGKLERYENGLEGIDITGSGLGLYICKEIVKLLGGQIWAESEGRYKGSTFKVKLPIK